MKYQQIPKSIRLLFDIYKQLSNKQNSVYHPQVGKYLSQTNDLNLIYQQWQILTNNRKKGDSIKNITERQFYSPSISFGDYELSLTKKLFIKPTKNHFSFITGLPLEDPIFSLKSHDKNRHGQFINNIENNLLSYYSPFTQYPQNSKSQLAYKYYLRKFDESIPIMIILKKKYQMFSIFSMNHWDKIYFDMKRQTRRQNILTNVDDLTIPSRRNMMKLSQRQFEFTSINRIDLFKLALGSYNYFKSLLNPTTIFLNKFNLNKNLQIAPWNGNEFTSQSYNNNNNNGDDDELIKMIDKNCRVEIRDQSTGDIILPDDSKLLEYVNKEKSYVKQLDQDEVMDYSQQIPYQLNFDKYYMLNILNFDSGDTRLSSFSRILNTATTTTTTTTTTGGGDKNSSNSDISPSDLEIVGVRLSLDNPQVNRMINEMSDIKLNNKDDDVFAYEDILKLVHTPKRNVLRSLMDILAVKGIIKVRQSADKRGLYLLP